MLFNSIDFAVFLPTVFVLYWFVMNRNIKVQNLFVVAASYVFYGWWDWRFLSLIIFSTLLDYSIGRKLGTEDNPNTRKVLLWASIAANLGLLGFFKYYNFFLDSFIAGFSLFGAKIKGDSLAIVLPVGISFYTFQTMSYTIDVYKRRLEPTKDIIAYSAYVSFFPQLVAGPIERATHLLSQFYVKRTFDYSRAVDGMRQILWGMFKKLVIADNCGIYADMCFNHPRDYSGSALVLGAVAFAFQVYGDFSGYSDIAIGTSRLFGFELRRNFNFPYFSRSIAEFWRRWHISLSTWLRDYLYIPLGGSRGGAWMKTRNVFAVFMLGGLWHGANWTFIVWGALHAIYYLPLLLTNRTRHYADVVAKGRYFPSLTELGLMLRTFGLFVVALVFFRADSIGHALGYLAGMLSRSLVAVPEFAGSGRPLAVLLLLVGFIIVEWFGREEQYAIARVGLKWRRPVRWALYAFLIVLIGIFMPTKETPFIYFQF